MAADPSLLRRCSSSTRRRSCYLAAIDARRGAARARSFFVDPDGATEDPATGSAAGPALRLSARALRHRARSTIDQGVEMGRPSRLVCELESDRVRVAGDCVVVATGTVHLGT